MPGMPTASEVEQLAALTGPAFDRFFLAVMIAHHRGTVDMIERVWDEGSDPRLWILGHAVAHPQREQMARMQALEKASSAHRR